jgi:hypothetical protein
MQNHPLGWAVSFLASLLAIGGAAYDALAQPEIRSSGSDQSWPFSLPFIVKNKSTFFTMEKVAFRCVPLKIVTVNNVRMYGPIDSGGIQNMAQPDISPGGEADFKCLFGRRGQNEAVVDFPRDDKVLTAKIAIGLTYRTVGVSRKPPPMEFTWYATANPPQWVEGHPTD